MKKIIFTLSLCAISLVSNAQLPYSKMIGLSAEELKEKKFKYNKGKNQYVLSKYNTLNLLGNISSALDGRTVDQKPHADDYIITIQYGENEQPSSLNMLFYNDDSFLKMQNWLTENNIDFIESTTGKKIIQTFKYDGFDIELYIEKVSISSTTGRTTTALVKSVDESYNIYSYTIYTGVAPASKWHEKKATKKANNDTKGKKKNIEDLF